MDPKYGWVYRYHSRSDAHSIALCTLILEDLLRVCSVLKNDALADKIDHDWRNRETYDVDDGSVVDW